METLVHIALHDAVHFFGHHAYEWLSERVSASNKTKIESAARQWIVQLVKDYPYVWFDFTEMSDHALLYRGQGDSSQDMFVVFGTSSARSDRRELKATNGTNDDALKLYYILQAVKSITGRDQRLYRFENGQYAGIARTSLVQTLFVW